MEKRSDSKRSSVGTPRATTRSSSAVVVSPNGGSNGLEPLRSYEQALLRIKLRSATTMADYLDKEEHVERIAQVIEHKRKGGAMRSTI